MSTYSQGVMGDGAAILKDGQLMTVDEIVAELQRGADGHLIAAGLLAGFALRVRRAEPYLRNGTITKFIAGLSGDMEEASEKMRAEL